MSISDKDRKILWGLSGGRCALCQRPLVTERTPVDDEAIVGDEAHIAARSPGGPRHGQGGPAAIDSYDNMILLCRVDHRTVDDQPLHYTVAHLKKIKADHEAWIKERLAEQPTPSHHDPVEANRRRTQVLSAYRVFRAALDGWETSINAVIDANVLPPGRDKQQRLREQCTQEWKNTYIACGHFAAAATVESAELAERVLDRWKSLADDAADGLLPSTHRGADPHDDILDTEDELLELVSTELGMTPSAVWTTMRPTGKLGGTGKRY